MTKAAALAFAAALAGCGGGLSSTTAGSASVVDDPLDVTPVRTPEQEGARASAARPPRPSVTPRPFRVADLPVVTIPEPLDATAAPTTLPPSLPEDPITAARLLIERPGLDEYATVSVSSDDRAIALVRVGDTQATSRRGLRIRCGVQRTHAAPARWEVLQRLDAGQARLTVVDGWFDAKKCQVSVVRRTSFSPRPVLGRLLYGFRECWGSCDDKQVVTFVGPPLREASATTVGAPTATSTEPFGKVSFELARGVGSSLSARMAPSTVEHWYGGRRPEWAQGPKDVLLGVDLAQGVDESEPVAIGYVGRIEDVSPSARATFDEPVDFAE